MTEAAQAAAGGDALSPAEAAYFESGGEKTEGLGVDETAAGQGNEAADKGQAEAAQQGAEAEGSQEQQDGKRRTVDYGAFHAEREQRKSFQAELAKEREDKAKLAARIELINEAIGNRQQRQQQEADTPPDPEQDIFGHVRWQASRIAQLEGKLGETTKAVQETANEAQVRDAYRSDVVSFAAKEAPDFGDAYAHLLNNRDQELALYGVDDPQERARIIVAEEKQLAATALKSGKSPAKVIYDYAKLRGYKPAAAGQQNGQQQANGQDKPSVGKEIEAIQRGQGASRTLSGGGTATDGPLTADALLAMSEPEFEAALSKLSKSEQRQLFGG